MALTHPVRKRMHALATEGSETAGIDDVLKLCKQLGPLLSKIRLPSVPPEPGGKGERRQHEMLKDLQKLAAEYSVWFHQGR